MILKLYSVRDNAVAAFLQPFWSPTNAAAIRSLTQAVNDPNHDISKNAADYSLWYLGYFDDSNGNFTPEPVERLINCVDLIKPSA